MTVGVNRRVNELPISGFLEAIQATHGATAHRTGQTHVEERFDGELVWEGDVQTFTLDDHPTADRAYAFVMDGEIVCVLHEPPVDSPIAAVRAAIMAEGLQ